MKRDRGFLFSRYLDFNVLEMNLHSTTAVKLQPDDTIVKARRRVVEINDLFAVQARCEVVALRHDFEFVPIERLEDLQSFRRGLCKPFAPGVFSGAPMAFLLAREFGLWLFLVPVVFLVAHRMIPFFSQSALINYMMVRPAWGPSLMLLCVVGHVLLELTGLTAWRFLADAPLAVAALHHSWVWQFRRSFHARLLAMLHIAFLWLGIGMTLYTVQSLALLVTGVDYLGRAPLHALGIGFFTGMVVAMASRVTLGHSGRALEASDLTWYVLFGVNIAAMLRIVAEFLPGTAGGILNVLAAATWLLSFLLWGWLYAPMYLRPLLDRKPG